MLYCAGVVNKPGARPRRTAFMLSQVGSAVSARFAVRTKRLGVTPSEAGVLRLVGRRPGISQRELADRLGTAPSRVVALIDGLEKRGLMVRTRSTTDRRNQELTLTDPGRAVLGDLRAIAEEHEADVLASLTQAQSDQLAALLDAVLTGLDLDADLHRET